jgi:hypothetical protein
LEIKNKIGVSTSYNLGSIFPILRSFNQRLIKQLSSMIPINRSTLLHMCTVEKSTLIRDAAHSNACGNPVFVWELLRHGQKHVGFRQPSQNEVGKRGLT